MLHLTEMPLWLSGLILVVVPTLIAAAGPLVVRRFVALERIATNNEVAGFKFATLGVIYAVVLGFTVIVVWERFAGAERTASTEAAAVATLYRLSEGVDRQTQENIRQTLSRYSAAVIDDEWVQMRVGGASETVQQALGAVYRAVLAFQPSGPRDAVLFNEILDNLDMVTEARRERLVLASGIIPPVLWLVLGAGAAVTIGFTFFFGTKNLRAQVLMTAMLALLIFMVLFVTVSIDHPFSGPVRVKPEALEAALRDFAGDPTPAGNGG